MRQNITLERSHQSAPSDFISCRHKKGLLLHPVGYCRAGKTILYDYILDCNSNHRGYHFKLPLVNCDITRTCTLSSLHTMTQALTAVVCFFEGYF
jgi:hypothetical protein